MVVFPVLRMIFRVYFRLASEFCRVVRELFSPGFFSWDDRGSSGGQGWARWQVAPHNWDSVSMIWDPSYRYIHI